MDLMKRKCGDVNHFIYSINKNCIIKHNLLSKRDSVIFRSKFSVEQYNIYDEDIVVGADYNIFWNGRKLAAYEPYTLIRYLRIKKGKCVAFGIDNFIDHNGEKIYCSRQPYFKSSPNGMTIIYQKLSEVGWKLYLQDASQITIDEIFVDCKAKQIKTIYCQYLEWIANSNFVVIDGCIIFDVDRSCEMTMMTQLRFYNFFVFLIKGMVVAWHYGFVEIYDVQKMVFVQRIDTELAFTDYNQMLDILLTDKKEYYRMKNNYNGYYLHKVTIGANYVSDYDVIPLKIKTIIDLCYVIILDALPNDILFAELYQQLLNHLDY